MKYLIYKSYTRHIQKIKFSNDSIEIAWCENPNGGKLFHIGTSQKYWAMPHSWWIISNIFGYNISLTVL